MNNPKQLHASIIGIVILSVVTVLCVRASLTMAGGSLAKKPLLAAKTGGKQSAAQPEIERFPYLTKRFTEILEESHSLCKSGESHDFYAWMDKAYADSGYRFPGHEDLSFRQLIRTERKELAAIKDPTKKTEAEIWLGARIHRLIKRTITKFSLDRGFEFCNVIKNGERQCLLQSVLIAGLLQDMGVNAGMVMVNKNPQGAESNNGHVIVLVKLPNGQDIIVDASEPEPFPRQQGLFVRRADNSDYIYVSPIYVDGSSSRIRYYRTTANNGKMSTYKIRPMDYGFVRSQFWYYRGERATGNLIWQKPTSEVLKQAEHSLRTSVSFCPKNPLSTYMLGRVLYAQGNVKQAQVMFRKAVDLYSKFGWTPPDPKYYLAKAGR